MPRLNLLSGGQQGSSECIFHPGPLQFEPAFSILPKEFWGYPSNIGIGTCCIGVAAAVNSEGLVAAGLALSARR